MSNTLFHNKFHLTNHHTVSSGGYPDSGIDPIAGPNDPFLGTFYNIIQSLTPNITTNSTEWSSTYTTLCSNSGTYYLFLTTRNTVTALSSNWQGGSSFYETYSPLSGSLNELYTFVRVNSSNWPFLDTTLRLNIPQESVGTKTFAGTTLTPVTVSAVVFADFLTGLANTVVLTGNFGTFYRNSSASYTNSNGFIQFVDVDTPRSDYLYSAVTSAWEPQGLLIERRRTNLIVHSEDFDDANWVTVGGITIAPDIVVSPSNLLSADELTIPSANCGIYQDILVSPNTTYTMSVYVRLGTLPAESYKISLYDNTNAVFFVQDAGPTIVPNKSTWSRIVYNFVAPAGCNSVRVYPFANTAPTGGTLFMWGAQVEQSGYASSYIQTVDTAYTRETEYGFLSGDIYNNAQGTFLFETNLLGTTANTGYTLVRFFGKDALNIDNDVFLRFTGQRGVNARGTINNSFVLTYNINSSLTATTYPRTIALSYSRNNVVLADSGNIAGIDISSLVPNSLSSAYIGLSAPNAGGDVFNGYIRRFAYYPRQFSNNTLRFLTLSSFEYSNIDEVQVVNWNLSSTQVAFLNLSANSFLQNPLQPANKFKGGEYILVVRQSQAGRNQLLFDRDYVTVSGLSATDIISLSSFSVTVIRFTCNGDKLFGKPTKYYYGLPDQYTYYSGGGIVINPNPAGLNAGEPFLNGGGLTIGVSAPYSGGSGITII